MPITPRMCSSALRLDGNHDNEILSVALKFLTYSYSPDTSYVTLDRDAYTSTIFVANKKEIKAQLIFGPNFADSYRMLCDIGTKTLYTLCSKEQIDGYVNISTEQASNSTNIASIAM
ncbi:unnamed protein product, partial [Aureobasidium pullulans]